MLNLFFFQAEDGIRDLTVTGVQTCALPIYVSLGRVGPGARQGRALGGRRGRAVRRLPHLSGPQGRGVVPRDPGTSGTPLARESAADLDRQGDARVPAQAVRLGRRAAARGASPDMVRRARA